MSETAERLALYRIRGEASLLLYIGISKHFGQRWWEHAMKQPWWDEMRSLSADEWYGSRAEARKAERAAIKAERPKHNKHHNKVRPVQARKVSRRQSGQPRTALVKPTGWMTMGEAAARAGCARQTLYAAEAKGYMEVRRLPGRRTLIHEDQLQQWVLAHQRPKGSPLSSKQAEFLLNVYLVRRVYDYPHYFATTRALAKLGLINEASPSGHALTVEGKRIARELHQQQNAEASAA